MILKPDLVYAEFLEQFLIIIQEEQNRNIASMVSGFLRSSNVATTMKSVCRDNTYLPLSSIIKAGLVNEQGAILSSSNNPKALQLALFFDKSRIQAALRALRVEKDHYTDIQQLTLITCCQEAVNRVLLGSFGLFAKNTSTISDPIKQKLIIDIMQNLSARALAPIITKLIFSHNNLSLTEESIQAIKEQKKQFITNASTNSIITISDADLPNSSTEPFIGVTCADRIIVLDELVPLLSANIEEFTATELAEHQAHRHLLTLYATILSMSAEGAWKVTAQWLSLGDAIETEDGTVTLPHTISKILNVIVRKPVLSYVSALLEIQDIARSYESDWYTWGRNQMPLLSSSSAVKDFLAFVLAVDKGACGPMTSPTNQRTLTFDQMIHTGLSFLSCGFMDDSQSAELDRQAQLTNNVGRALRSTSP